MKLTSTTHAFNNYYDLKTSVKFLKEAGFDSYDISLFPQCVKNEISEKADYAEYAKEIRDFADSIGISCTQSHATFPSSVGDEEKDAKIYKEIVRDMEFAAILGAEIIVVHPKHFLKYGEYPEKLFEMNLEFYKSLIPYCEKFGIKVAIENMYERHPVNRYIIHGLNSRPQEFARMLDEIDSEWIVGCVDVGHVALVGADLTHFIKTLGNRRIQALHIHDVTKTEDCHTLPGTLSLDFNAVTKALAEIDYKGNFTFEADNFFNGFPVDFYPQVSEFMCKVGRRLIEQIEENK